MFTDNDTASNEDYDTSPSDISPSDYDTSCSNSQDESLSQRSSDLSLDDDDDGYFDLNLPLWSSPFADVVDRNEFEPTDFERKYLDSENEQRLKSLWQSSNHRKFWRLFDQLIPQIVDGEECFFEPMGVPDLYSDFLEDKIEPVAEQAHPKIRTVKCPKCKTKGRTCGKWKVREKTACECTSVNFHKRQWQKLKTGVKRGRQQANDEKYRLV